LGRRINRLPAMDQEFRIAFMRLNCTSVKRGDGVGCTVPASKATRVVSVNNLSVNNEES